MNQENISKLDQLDDYERGNVVIIDTFSHCLQKYTIDNVPNKISRNGWDELKQYL